MFCLFVLHIIITKSQSFKITTSSAQPLDNNCVKLLVPPPNLTGNLHIGHGMNMVGSDVYLKYKEMLGNTVDVLFGNDHAGQGFQKLYVKKHGYDSEINMLRGGLDYCKKLRKRHIKTLRDLSLMWRYGNWTLDTRSRAVTKDVFKRLFKDGLIEVCDWPTYARIVDDKLELISAADVDVISRQINLYAYKTEIHGIEIVINTTCPEFLYATTGVGVSSDLYKSLSSYNFTIPNLNRIVPFIDLGNVDSNRFIIPAHFESDYWLAKEKKMDIVSIISLEGKLKNVPEELMNKPFKYLKDHLNPSFTKLYEVTRNLPVDILGRDDVSILMLPAPNYVLNTKELARRALSILNNNEIDIKPINRLDMLKNRLNNIRPWCISRYNWWGIRIPDVSQRIKYETENTSETSSSLLADSYNSTDANLVGGPKDELPAGKSDISAHYRSLTFDTWFTSALWPIITGFTSGEGDKVLYTSYDILETWVCRMLLLCPYVVGTVPFNKLYLHGIVIDSRGKKMSKSAGNAMSIEELKEKFKSGGDLAMVDEVSQTRMLLSSLSSKSDFAYKFDLKTDKTSSLLKKLLEITNFVTKTTNDLNIKYFWDVPEEEDLDFIQEAISTKLSQYGVNVGAFIEDFEFNKSLESLEKYVKVFSEYAISYLRFSNSKNLGWFIKYYTNMLRLFVPYATNFVLRMRLPLKMNVTNELFVWPNFTNDNVGNSRIKLSDALQELLPLLDNPEDPKTIISYSISEDEDEASNSAKSLYPAESSITQRSATEELDATESNTSSDVISNRIVDADQGKRVEGSIGRGGIIGEGTSFDLLDEVVREVRKGVKNGHSEVDVRVPADLYSEIFEYRGYIEYLAKLTYNKLPRVNVIRI